MQWCKSIAWVVISGRTKWVIRKHRERKSLHDCGANLSESAMEPLEGLPLFKRLLDFNVVWFQMKTAKHCHCYWRGCHMDWMKIKENWLCRPCTESNGTWLKKGLVLRLCAATTTVRFYLLLCPIAMILNYPVCEHFVWLVWHGYHEYHTQFKIGSLVPRPIPRFSMLNTEKQEGLACKVTWWREGERRYECWQGAL